MVSAAWTTPTGPSGQSVLVSPTVREKTFIFQITSVVDARLQRNSVWGIACLPWLAPGVGHRRCSATQTPSSAFAPTHKAREIDYNFLEEISV